MLLAFSIHGARDRSVLMCEVRQSTGNWDTRSVYTCEPCKDVVLEKAEARGSVLLNDLSDQAVEQIANGVCLEAYRWYSDLEDSTKKPELYYERAAERFGSQLKEKHRSYLEQRAAWEDIGHFFKGIGLMFQDTGSWLDHSLESIETYLTGPREYYVAPPQMLSGADTQFA